MNVISMWTMGRYFDDTPPEIEGEMLRRLRELSPAQKAAQMVALNHATQMLALSRIRRDHPEADERELELRLASLWLDRETMIRVFGWDPAVHGD